MQTAQGEDDVDGPNPMRAGSSRSAVTGYENFGGGSSSPLGLEGMFTLPSDDP